MKFTSLGLSDDLLEASKSVLEGSKEYQDFFKSALKKFGVTSPAEFKSDEEKKKFFDYVDKNYKGKNEENSNEIDEAKPSKKFIKLGDNAEKKNLRLAVEKINPKKQEQIIDLYNKLMDVKHGGPEFKKMKAQIAKLQKEEVVSEASRDYYKQVDALIAKHGNEKPFIYKSPKLNKILSDLTKLMKSEKEFPDSQKYGKLIQGHLKKCEVMGYEENIVLTNKMHDKFSKDFQGDTMFREEMAEIIMQDDILSYAIFGE